MSACLINPLALPGFAVASVTWRSLNIRRQTGQLLHTDRQKAGKGGKSHYEPPDSIQGLQPREKNEIDAPVGGYWVKVERFTETLAKQRQQPRQPFSAVDWSRMGQAAVLANKDGLWDRHNFTNAQRTSTLPNTGSSAFRYDIILHVFDMADWLRKALV